MLSFSEYLIEVAGGGRGASADAEGKLEEIGVGKKLNGDKHMSHSRTEDKGPEAIRHRLLSTMHGDKYENHPKVKEKEKDYANNAKHISSFIQKKGHGKPKKAHWVSQASDKEEGEADKGDIHVETDKGKKISISAKTGFGKVNHDNPGIRKFEQISKTKLSSHGEAHKAVLEKNLPKGPGDANKKYKALAASDKPADKRKAAAIKASSTEMNQSVGKAFHGGLKKQSSNELKKSIKDAIAPKTKVKQIVTRTITDKKTGKQKEHQVYDHHEHVDNYLNHFEHLHVDEKHPKGQASVTVYGHYRHPTNRKHPDNGKRMPVASWSVYGRAAATSSRGATTLPSEDHPLISKEHKSIQKAK